MKHFNFWSLHKSVDGYMVWINNPRFGLWPTVIAHANTDNYRQRLAKAERIWRKNVPGVPFEYTFMDDYVGQMYEADITISRIINSFTLMAVIISCLGLFGLAAFSAEQRSKGMLALALALATVSFHAIKAAVVNPVRSLRSE